jgi:hypothetical protein
MPEMMILVGMLICGNYNTIGWGNTSYWMIFLGLNVQNTPQDEQQIYNILHLLNQPTNSMTIAIS